MLIWFFLIGTLCVLFYLKVKKAHSHWQREGIVHIKPAFLIGQAQVIRKECFPEEHLRWYNAFPNERYFGSYNFLEPFVFIRDINLIKQITVKAFEHFHDHRSFADSKIDKFWTKNLFTTTGQKWRTMRATLSPSFTASKMKIMFVLMDDCARQFVDYYKTSSKGANIIELDVKDSFSRYTNYVIASTAFGIQCDSLKMKTNAFYLAGKEAADFTGLRSLRLAMYMLSPAISNFLRVTVIPARLQAFFTQSIAETLHVRKSQRIYRPDMIQLLLEAQQADESNTEITLEDISAHAFLFFLAGFETVSNLLSFACYELALNPTVQSKLRTEIRAQQTQISYEHLHRMKYLDMVVSETLRLWPPASFMERLCTKDFTIEPVRAGEKAFTIRKGVDCLIPIVGLHRDGEYFPEPERFDPERFSEENVGNIVTGSYVPFGYGPRICIGNRFALMESKLMLYHIVGNFEVLPIDKTHIPMVLDKKQTAFVAKGGMWLGLKPLIN